jgi:hypothetical protein
MKNRRVRNFIQILMVIVALVLLTETAALAKVEFNVDVIETEIVAAVAAGADPVLAAKQAVVNAVRAIIEANPDYPGGREALRIAIFEALADLKITGLDDTDLYVSANHALGNTIDPELEAYEPPSSGPNAKNKSGGSYGPGGKPKPGSPT